MAYKRYLLALLLRSAFLFISLFALAGAILLLDFKTELPIAIVTISPVIFIVVYAFVNLYKFVIRRFIEMDDFFESVKYRDFSRWFTEKSGPEDIRKLHKGFNEVNKTIKEINKEKEAQHLYLQKILELMDTGIMTYSMDSGKVLWSNDSFKEILGIPSLKTTQFIQNRNQKLYDAIFEINHAEGHTIEVEVNKEKIKILINSSIFLIEEESFKLVVIKNIDDTINRAESEAWKKLLSVMTHEIMNSIAPISSLAETLQYKIRASVENPDKNELEISDLNDGIETIKNRSQGLLKFAKTFRSLNKITKLNLNKVLISGLFDNIKTLMEPSLEKKHIELNFEIDTPDLKIEMDTYLIEQVLINLILNSVEALKETENPRIIISAQKNIEGRSIIKVIDNGGGISEEIRDQIFIPFFSTKKTGSGIGLSLCKQIVLLHNGKLQVTSELGKGTVIRVVF
jgi:signal transduction histidine kinase